MVQYDLTGITQTQLELDEKIAGDDENDAFENLEGYKDVLNGSKKIKGKQRNWRISTADGLPGGMGSTIKGFVTNPLTICRNISKFGATQGI